MADLSITPASVRWISGPLPYRCTAGAAITRGQALYHDDADNEYKLADADLDANSVFAGLALTDGFDGRLMLVAQPGSVVDVGATTLAGMPYVVSANPGGIAPFADVAFSDWTNVLFIGSGTGQVELVAKRGGGYSGLLAAMGCVLYYNGALTGGGLLRNLISGGSAYDGTPIDVTIDANGMNFNGTTSRIQIPAGIAAAAGENYTIVIECNPSSAGEGSFGNLISSQNFRVNIRFNGSANVLRSYETSNATAGNVITNSGQTLTIGSRQLLHRTFANTGDRRIHLYKSIAGATTELTYSTDTAMTGTRLADTGHLNAGNDDTGNVTFAGSMQRIMIFNKVLDSGEREALRIASAL